jgi:hypothetical protein
VLAYIQYFLYHRPGTGGFQGHEFLSQQYLKHTPLVTGVVVASAAIIASTSGVLAFFIFRSSRFAIVVMLAFVTLLQLYTWLVAHSFAGTILSIVVVAFLLRGAKRIFEDHAERSVGTQKL